MKGFKTPRVVHCIQAHGGVPGMTENSLPLGGNDQLPMTN